MKRDGDKKKKHEDESNSIQNQRQILLDYARKHGYKNLMFFVDDGISGTSFERSDFQRMQALAESGKVSTIIVKDLSRFGREQVEAGRLTQIVYPSLGITFISIQENVNSTTGDGMEMLPFYNIFNEWYAAQTSKKIRAVWQSKAENGKRVSPAVPYGYMKDPNDKEKWLIDLLAQKTKAMKRAEFQKMQQAVEHGQRRIENLDRLIEKIYEDKVLGDLSEERYMKMMRKYEQEQKELIETVSAYKEELQNAEQKAVDLRLMLKTIREITDIQELTPTLVNSLIERIEVHNSDRSTGKIRVKVDIYFTAVGMIDIPTEQEILRVMDEIRGNPQNFRFVS